MRRRDFITVLGSMAVWPLTAAAQQLPGKVWRVAWLYPGSVDTDRAVFDVFRAEMRDLGYIEGKNLIINSSGAGAEIERLPSLASALIALGPDVIVATGADSVAAVRHATSAIPIVMCPGGEPVGSGFVKSLAHPGGNITGLADLNDDAIGKVIELLHAVLPAATRFAVLVSSNPNHPQRYQLAEAAAKALGLVAVPLSVPSPAAIEHAFARLVQEKCDALVVLPDPIRPTIISLAAKMRIPTFYSATPYVAFGGLASYGASLPPMWRKAAVYVDKIIKGANPAELPVEQPVAFELALNLKTAAALGLTFPDTVIARADKVIE